MTIRNNHGLYLQHLIHQSQTESGGEKEKKTLVDKFTISFDSAKESDRNDQCLGGDPAEFNVSCATVCRHWVNSRQKIAGNLKPTFKPVAPPTVHWDDKLIEDICSKEVVDRLLSLTSRFGVVWVRRSFIFCSLLSSCGVERKQSSQIYVLRHHVSQQWTKNVAHLYCWSRNWTRICCDVHVTVTF